MSDDPQEAATAQDPPPQQDTPAASPAPPAVSPAPPATSPATAKPSFMRRKPVQLVGTGIAGVALGVVVGGGTVAAIVHHHGPDREHPAQLDKRDSRWEMQRERPHQQPQRPNRRLPDQPPQSR